MSEYICFLISVLDPHQWRLVTCAIKVKMELLSEEAKEDAMENRDDFKRYLPPYLQGLGPIVNIEPLFEVAVFENEESLIHGH